MGINPTQSIEYRAPWRVFLLAGLLMAFLISPIPAFQSNDFADTPSIPELIRRLESRTFAERERATQQLVQAGRATLRPLARNLGSASPETVYRSRKIIQEIAKSGDEATFLRSAGILKLVMFGTLEENYGPIKLLEKEWKSRRTEIAAEALRNFGAQVQLANEKMEVIGGGLNPLRLAVVSYPTREAPEPKKKQPKRLTKKEFQQAIDKILVGSIDHNRTLVFGDFETQPELSPNEQLLNQLRAQQVWRDRRAFADNDSFGNIGNAVTIGPDWNGDEELFAQLNAIENLTDLKLQDLEVSEGYTRVLKRLADLDRLEINNCTIAADEIEDIAQLETITHVTIARQRDAVQFLTAFQETPNLRGVELADCKFQNGELATLAKCENLVQVFLTGIDVPADALYDIGALKRLRYMSMKSCTFNVEAFQSLKKRRSNVTFTTVARAFLGVRGPIEFGNAGFECKISEVIPGSGADQAGVIVGDVITKINDHDIEVFNDLILYISQHDIGDGLKLEVIRDGKKLKLSAELGERDPNIQ